MSTPADHPDRHQRAAETRGAHSSPRTPPPAQSCCLRAHRLLAISPRPPSSSAQFTPPLAVHPQPRHCCGSWPARSPHGDALVPGDHRPPSPHAPDAPHPRTLSPFRASGPARMERRCRVLVPRAWASPPTPGAARADSTRIRCVQSRAIPLRDALRSGIAGKAPERSRRPGARHWRHGAAAPPGGALAPETRPGDLERGAASVQPLGKGPHADPVPGWRSAWPQDDSGRPCPGVLVRMAAPRTLIWELYSTGSLGRAWRGDPRPTLPRPVARGHPRPAQIPGPASAACPPPSHLLHWVSSGRSSLTTSKSHQSAFGRCLSTCLPPTQTLVPGNGLGS